MERVEIVEISSSAWKADIMPLYYTRSLDKNGEEVSPRLLGGSWLGQQGSNLRPLVPKTSNLPTDICPNISGIRVVKFSNYSRPHSYGLKPFG